MNLIETDALENHNFCTWFKGNYFLTGCSALDVNTNYVPATLIKFMVSGKSAY